ncbi:zinc-binding dehydrogenase [Sorangium sp. So ce726]|uniref:quinone oxidoreductase family protein n=1 Tax=Sorangium sp. So ce726 TaxID=3133319 RepID=UPI003F62BF8A
MKALCVTPDRSLVVRDVPAPRDPPPEHVVLRMEACAINPGDKFFLSAPPPRGARRGEHDVWGASGAGTVVAAGAGVPPEWVGRRVAVYRSLSPSDPALGTWSTLAQMHARCCALIPDGLDARDYSGSLVNVITAYAFAKQAQADGHRGALITAGTSATGVALVGIARSFGLATVAIVRGEAGRQKLSGLGADDVIAQSDASFDTDVQVAIERRAATAVFDGVGGALLTRLVPRLAHASTVHSYGHLGGRDVPLQIPTALLMTKALTLRSFSNIASPTVREPQSLDAALRHIGDLLALPHCKTPLGRTYTFEQIDEAMAAIGNGEGKPLLLPERSLTA